MTTIYNIAKLQSLYQVSLSRLPSCLRIRPEPTQVKHLSGAPVLGKLLALPINIRLGWKGQPRTKTFIKIRAIKIFIILAPKWSSL